MRRLKRILEKGLYASLGFWLLIHEKADELIREMIKKGEMAPEEGRKFLDELSRKVNEEKEAIKDRIEELVQTSLSDIFVTKKDFEKLLKIVEALEKNKGSSASVSRESSKKPR